MDPKLDNTQIDVDYSLDNSTWEPLITEREPKSPKHRFGTVIPRDLLGRFVNNHQIDDHRISLPFRLVVPFSFVYTAPNRSFWSISISDRRALPIATVKESVSGPSRPFANAIRMERVLTRIACRKRTFFPVSMRPSNNRLTNRSGRSLLRDKSHVNVTIGWVKPRRISVSYHTTKVNPPMWWLDLSNRSSMWYAFRQIHLQTRST